MKFVVGVLIVAISVLDMADVIHLPLFASVGIFLVTMLIVLDTIFGGRDQDRSKTPKDQS